MFVKQLSIFLENREGRLENVLKILKDNNINLFSLSLADTSEFGLLRLIVSDPEKGLEAVKEAGFSARLTDVFAVKLADKAGKLQELLQIVCTAGINIEYMYAMGTGNDNASIIFKSHEGEKAAQLLQNSGVEFITF